MPKALIGQQFNSHIKKKLLKQPKHEQEGLEFSDHMEPYKSYENDELGALGIPVWQ